MVMVLVKVIMHKAYFCYIMTCQNIAFENHQFLNFWFRSWYLHTYLIEEHYNFLLICWYTLGLFHCLSRFYPRVSQPSSTHHFFLKCPVPSQENGSCYLIVRFCVCYIVVFCYTSMFLLFRCFPLIVDVFPSILVCNPILFSLNRFMTFEQRYTTVAFI